MRRATQRPAALFAALSILGASAFLLKLLPARALSGPRIHVAKRADWVGQPKYQPGELLVRFRPGTQSWAKEAAHSAAGAQVAKSWTSVEGLQLVRLSAGMKLKDAIRSYRRNPSVLYAEPNYIVHALGTPNDPGFSQMWGLQNTGQDGGVPEADIRATQAWSITTGSSSVVVAVVDTGIDYNHQDLAANVWSNPSPFSGSIDGLSVSCASGTHGFNAITGTCDPLDDHGHGSHVSGTIGAVGNNGIGTVGVNWTVQLMACKFLDAFGFGSTSGAITCLDFVKAMKDRGINIVATNNSWGGGDFSMALADAIQAQQQDGILFIAAAGNDFSDNDVVPAYPADYFLPNLISVAATTRFDQLADFSNVGRHSVYLGAPGQEVLSTTPNNTYSVFSGTSMATPHVTGVAALLAAQNPSRDWRAIKNLILASGDTIPALTQTITGKRLNAYGALTCTNSPILERLQPTLASIPASTGQLVTLAALNINCGQPAGPVLVTVSPGGQVVTLLDNGVAPDQASGDGIYTGQWTPPGLGNFSLAFPGGDMVQVTVLSNYTVGETTFNYQNIAGTNLNLGDDDVATITSPFPVSFGGGGFTQLYLSSNGTISFTNAFGDFINQPLPLNIFRHINPGNPPPPAIDQSVVTLVAPFWEDLYPVKGTSQNVFWQVTGSAPNRQLIIEWRNVRTYDCRADSNATVTFQVVFSESSANFIFNYSNVIFGGSCSDQNYAAAATVGMEITQDVGTEWSLDQQAVGNGMSLLWTIAAANPPPNPVPTLTSISPSSIPSGSGDTLVTLTGSGFVPASEVLAGPVTRFVTTYVSSTELQGLIPATSITTVAGGTFQLHVTNPPPGGGSSQSLPLTIVGQLPQITSISPPSIPAGSFGFVLTINGSGFYFGSDVVWNGAGGQSTFVSSNQITFAVPGYLLTNPGTVTVQVQNAVNVFSNTVTFTITSATAPAAISAPPPSALGGPPGSPAPRTPKRKATPLPGRFPGWKYAAQRGPDYVTRFLRRRADVAASLLPLAGGMAASSASATTLPPPPGFNFRPALPADFFPTAVVTGDFNGDGRMDWAVANAGSNNIWIYLGKGDGTAQLPTIVSLKGAGPVALAVADMNHDGKLDLVVAEADSGSVGILLGNGDGTFGPEREFFVPGGPESIAVADFNGDGNPDVVVGLFGDYATGQLAFLPGDGTGKLGLPIFHFDQINDGLFDTFYIAAADLNGDGLPDIVALDFSVAFEGIFLSSQMANAGARVYLSQGNGTFKNAQQFFFDVSDNQEAGLGTAATAVALGDVNKDGCVDAVVLDTEGVATFLPGKCDGTFDTSKIRIFGTGIVAGAATLADMNNDGKLDLVASAFPFAIDPDYFSSMGNSVSVLFGEGTGNFSAPTLFRGEPGMHSLAVADLNGDGHPDLVTANQDSDSASVYLNDGKGGFGGPVGAYLGYLAGGQMHAVFDSSYTPFAYVDVNGDGKKDLVLIEIGTQYPLPYQLTVLLGSGSGTFGTPIRSPVLDLGVNQGIFDFTLADFQNRGLPDLLLLGVQGTPGQPNPAPFFLYSKNNGDGTFQKPVLTPLTNLFPVHFLVGDFNNDGKLDVIVVSFASSSTGTGTTASLIPFLGKGDGTFTQGTALAFNSSASISPFIREALAADVNHDGKLDLLVAGNQLLSANDQNALYEFLGNGDGTFQPPKLLFSDPTRTSYFATADFNKDGIPDLVEEAVHGLVDGQIPRIFRTYLGQPDGTFKLTGTFGPFVNEFAFALLFGSPTKPLVPVQPTVADFNGDGNLDVAVFAIIAGQSLNANGISGGAVGTTLEILAGNGDGTFTPSSLSFNLGSLVAPQLSADVNGDNHADLVEIDGYSDSYDIVTAQPGPSFGLALVASPVVGTNGKLRIALAYPSAAGTILQLSASDPAISIAPSVTIPAGTTIQDVPFQIGSGFNPSHVFSLSARVGTETHTAYSSQANNSAEVGFISFLFNPPPSTPVIFASQSITYQFQIVSLGGYSTELQPSCQGLPAGASCQFEVNPIYLPAGAALLQSFTVATQAGTPFGRYPFNMVLTDGFLTFQIPLVFDVGDFTMSITPTTQQVQINGSFSYTLTLQGVAGFSAPVQLTCTALPAGAGCSLNGMGPQLPGTQGIPFQIQTQNVTPGTYSFTVSGTSGSLMHSTSAQFVVQAATFTGTISPVGALIPVGHSQTFNVMVSSVSGFSGQVSFSCPGLPSGITCTFNPFQVSLNPSASAASILTIFVSAKPGAALPSKSAHDSGFVVSPMLLETSRILVAFMVVFIFTIRFGGTSNCPRMRHVSAAIAALTLALVVGISSCGGGGGGSGGGGGGGGGGAPVIVPVAVQATSGNITLTLDTLSITVP